MKSAPKEKPEIKPQPDKEPFVPPAPEITPTPEKIQPYPSTPEREPLTRPEVEPPPSNSIS